MIMKIFFKQFAVQHRVLKFGVPSMCFEGLFYKNNTKIEKKKNLKTNIKVSYF